MVELAVQLLPYSLTTVLLHLPPSGSALPQEKAPGRATPPRRAPMEKNVTGWHVSDQDTGHTLGSMIFPSVSERQDLEGPSYLLHLLLCPLDLWSTRSLIFLYSHMLEYLILFMPVSQHGLPDGSHMPTVCLSPAQ